MGEEPFASGPEVPGAPQRRMRGAAAFALLSGLLTGLGGSARAEIELIPERVPQAVFAGGKRLVSVKVRNPDALAIQAHLRSRIYQANAATPPPLEGIRPWKVLSLPPGQTAVHSLGAEIPQLGGETAFQIIFFGGTKGGGVLGAGEARLISIGRMSAGSQRAGLGAAVKKKAANGAAIVWIQSASRESAFCTYVVPEGSGRIVVAPASAIADLADSPRTQLNLVWPGESATS